MECECVRACVCVCMFLVYFVGIRFLALSLFPFLSLSLTQTHLFNRPRCEAFRHYMYVYVYSSAVISIQYIWSTPNNVSQIVHHSHAVWLCDWMWKCFCRQTRVFTNTHAYTQTFQQYSYIASFLAFQVRCDINKKKILTYTRARAYKREIV